MGRWQAYFANEESYNTQLFFIFMMKVEERLRKENKLIS